jgi:Leucine-rich repeat (LRR) protein
MQRRPLNPAFAEAHAAAPKGSRKVELGLKRARAEGVLLLSDCGLGALPAALFDLLSTVADGELSLGCCSTEELTKVDFSHNTIAELPDAAAWESLHALAYLRLHDNALRAPIDDTLCRVRALELLDLSTNKLDALSCGAEGLGVLTRLRELDVSHNALRSLGPSLPPSLEVLRVGHNRLDALPSDLQGCTRLNALDASHNALAGLVLALPALVALELAHNRLGAGVCDVRGCGALRLLDVRDNGLDALPALPSGSGLVRLFAGHNRLRALHTAAGEPLEACVGPSLCELHLNDNCLHALAEPLARALLGLKVLALGNNALADLPSALGYLPALTHLTLDGNPLRQVRRALWGSCEALKKHLRSRAPPPAGDGYLPADELGAAEAGGAARAELDAAALTRITRAAASGARVLDVGGLGLRAAALAAALRALAEMAGGGGGGGVSGDGLASGAQPASARRVAHHYDRRAPPWATEQPAGADGGADGGADATEAADGGGRGCALELVSEWRCGGSELGELPGAPELRALDELLPRMRALHSLDLSECNLHALAPLRAARGLRLRALALARNRLECAEVEALLAGPCALVEALEQLDISSNRLNRLPAGALALRRLHTLSLAHNAIRSTAGCWPARAGAPAADPPSRLTHLDLSSNQLVELGELPLLLLRAGPVVKTLSLENNELRALPAALGALTSLQALLVGGNPQKGVRTAVIERGTVALLEFLREHASQPRAPGKAQAGAERVVEHSTPDLCEDELDARVRAGDVSNEAKVEDARGLALCAALAALNAQLEGRAGPTLSEAKRFALKKEAAKAKAELIRHERLRPQPPH